MKTCAFRSLTTNEKLQHDVLSQDAKSVLHMTQLDITSDMSHGREGVIQASTPRLRCDSYHVTCVFYSKKSLGSPLIPGLDFFF